MDLTTISLQLAIAMFAIVQILPCMGGKVSTMSPIFTQSSTLPSYQDTDNFCSSPQYFELGMKAVLNCSFPQVYFGIFWYNASEFANSKPLPLIYLKTSGKGGHGYQSNVYDINENGSLIINTVALQHDQNFTAIVFKSPTDEYSPNNIRVIVTVKPYQAHPYIEGCNEDERVCFRKIIEPFELACRVVDARPNVQLEWLKKTVGDDHVLKSENNVTLNQFLYTTRVKLANIMFDAKEVMVFLCKSVSLPSLLKNDESVVVVKTALKSLKNVTIVTKYVQYATPFYLTCTDQDVLYIVWQKESPNGSWENVMDGLFMNNTAIIKSYSTEDKLGNESSLRINKAGESDEGLYVCVFGDGISEDIRKVDVQVYEMTDSTYPFIEGCSHRRYCVLHVPREDTLTCIIQGVRPTVELKLEVKGSHTHSVTFFDDKRKVTRNGLKFEICLTSHFRIRNELKTRFSITCTASDYGDGSSLSTIIYLTPLDGEEESENSWKIAVPVSLFGIILIAVTVAAVAYYVKKNRRPNNATDEEMPMIEKPDDEKVTRFKRELRRTYLSSCERFRPLPYDRAVEYSLSKIFVEGEIECLETELHEQFGKLNLWQKLKSHNQFLNPSLQNNARIILEGEPGYGKTTLGYQFAYDWSTKSQDSPLINVNIHILLRLRYLKNISSIPDAIKKFLLPENTLFTAKDVRNILYFSESLVIYLDGFNRFSDNMNEQADLMNEVYTNNISSKCQVIVTTKPFCLPHGHADNAKRMRLTGFGESTWKNYLENCISEKYLRGSSDRIIQILRNNSLLGDLCQVPLLFVLFAHIESSDTFHGSDVKTLTDFFKILMECFHSKMYHDKPDKHTALSRVAFNGLIHDEKGLNWEKSDISHQLSESLYKEYCGIGILVERQFSSHSRRGKQARSSSKYETRVRFFHDIFCEWYAAHWLAKVATTGSQEKRKKCFDRINLMDHQYVYRFTCGMDSTAAKEIIKYIQELRDGETFSILCTLEQARNFEEVKDIIENICSFPVIINAHDSLFLQRSTIQVLQFASNKGINIKLVWLGKQNGKLDLPKESLEFSSGLLLPKLATMCELYIRDRGRKFSKDEFLGFLKYASLSTSLKTLRFGDCLLPFLQPEDLASEKNFPGQKEKEVQWETPDREWYKLDLESGIWKRKEEGMSQEYYDELVQSFGVSFQTGGRTKDFSADSGACTSASA